jgi:hypothetical protein
MKRIEVKLSLEVVAPLLDVIKRTAGSLSRRLAAPNSVQDLDPEFRATWEGELLASQNSDVRQLLALFGDEFFVEGMIALDEKNAEPLVRAAAAIRLKLRELHLKDFGDETLETSDVDITQLDDETRRAFMAYLFLATLQELIIQHLDSSIIES